jgi:DUF971 family protein
MSIQKVGFAKFGTGGRLDGVALFALNSGMKPTDIQQIGGELAIKWDDGSESFIPLEKLRRHCPCAGCKGEVDVMGNLYKNPERPLTPEAFRLVRIMSVGGYALQPVWADGHATGIYSFEYLKQIKTSTGNEHA